MTPLSLISALSLSLSIALSDSALAQSRPQPRPDRSQADTVAVQPALSGGLSQQADGTAPLSEEMLTTIRSAFNSCWHWSPPDGTVRVVVTVAVSFSVDGRVQGEIRLLRADPADAPARDIDFAFQAARRAILRCQQGGYPFDPASFASWKDMEIRFDFLGQGGTS